MQDEAVRRGAVEDGMMRRPEAVAEPSEVAEDPHWVEPEDHEPPVMTEKSHRRLLTVFTVLVVVGLLLVLPPLVNVSRYQRRVAASISTSLGRPVHLDSVTLNLLPMPGFTLTNFVVSEDPSFGAEPVIQANEVTATLRMRSLWHRRLEFSRIALDSPSVNLVRRTDGRWNIEGILLQASRMPAVPTDQRQPGSAPRFPYISAKNARVNFKSGLEKKPLSLLDAEFALWLSQPEMWKVRLEAHPTRTDLTTADTGVLRVDGTLGKASRLEDVPIDLSAEWSNAPLGAASRVLMGHDGGMRGDLNLRVSAKGTVGNNVATARLELQKVRREEFYPDRTLDVDVSCKAKAQGVFHHLTELKCLWPPSAEQSGLGGLTTTGEIGDIHRLGETDLQAKWNGVQMSDVLDVLRMESPRIGKSVEMGGMLGGEATCCGDGPLHGLSASFALAHARLNVDGKVFHGEDTEVPGELEAGKVAVDPFELDLGGAQPALLTVTADDTGVQMRLTGMVLQSRLMELGKALPQFGDGMEAALPVVVASPVKTEEAPVKVDLVGTRIWGGGVRWEAAKVVVVKRGRRR